MSETTRHRGQTLRASGNEWSRMRVAAGLSITDLAARSELPRSIVGLIDQGRLAPTPAQSKALVAVLEGTA